LGSWVLISAGWYESYGSNGFGAGQFNGPSGECGPTYPSLTREHTPATHWPFGRLSFLTLLANRPLIREQAFGEALDPDKLERLGRYEVHLDRKLERMLAMLLRLKDLRAGAVPG